MTMTPGQSEPDVAIALAAYYADRKLLRRNIGLILLLSLGWSACFVVVNPLILLALNKAGVGDAAIGLLGSINSWAYSYLVMYFAWKSDHTVSRFGRRIPYLFISAPFIIVPVVLFPFFHDKWVLLALALIEMLFMDIKAATIPLLNYDCVPRHLFARVNALCAIVMGAVNFLSLRFGMHLADVFESAPYLLAGGTLTLTTLIGGLFIREPPIRHPTRESFKPWSAMKIAWQDKRLIVLMVGINLGVTFSAMYTQWIWLFAKDDLALSRADTGAAMSWAILLSVLVSYPVGWFIDRFGSYIVLGMCWVLMYGATVLINHFTHGPRTLSAAALILESMTLLYGSAYILLARDADRKHLGSITSTNSFLRGVFVGASVLISGALIQGTGNNYRLAFIFGASVSTVGFALMMIYGYLMHPGQSPPDHMLAAPLDPLQTSLPPILETLE
jgi:hypothetical protein